MRMAWSLRALAMAAVALLVASCASTPQAPRSRDTEAKAFEAYPGAATVYVYRSPFNHEDQDSVLYIDGRLIGATLPGTYFKINVPPGRHTLHGTGVDIGQITLDMRPGTLYFVDLAVIAGHSRFQSVAPAEGRQQVVGCCVLLENWAPGQRPLLR